MYTCTGMCSEYDSIAKVSCIYMYMYMCMHVDVCMHVYMCSTYMYNNII